MIAFGFKGPDAAQAGNLESWLSDLRTAGFSWMEIRAPEERDPAWEARLQEWRERDGWSLAVHARFFGVNLSSPNPRVRRAAVEVALEDLMFASRIGAKRLNVHAGDVNWYDIPPPDHSAHASMVHELNRLRAQHLAAAAISIAEIGEAAREMDIEVVVENLYKPWELLRTPEETRDFFERLEPRIGFTLDVGHARIAGCSPIAFMEALNRRVRHIHLHWNDGLFDTHDFPDLSEPDLRELVRASAQFSPQVLLVIEILPGSSNGRIEPFCEWPAQAYAVLREKM
ncbi:MAG: sugar phosphate isomerase/epimerase [Thermoflexus sp.]|uniref:sugar phosphate isomerase/epimerase family protein n=1 Tax=Thermoflexus sp. TaxID=1969742 RepID=UPI0026012520|nr:sugar phosphate isomerase/epimerase family protein [Thermoflexus sp.]MCS6964042.1 sugar phosphate isomerase/epimerase [Thermoflexus sp.]MDW8065601.1 sugar phosphate isomerase/epimerase family protein [Anaerolineae bacterium]MDW8183880.1 sugar phosphate isomerase/epimerase family protein [Anaerolineae bacterium]